MTSIPVTIYGLSDNNFKRLYIKKQRLFFDFLLHSEICMEFRTFWKKRRVSYPNYYRNHCIRRRCLLKRLKGCFSTPFGNQRVNGFETLLKSARHHHFPIFQWIWDKLSWKKSPFVTSQIFWLFVNTLSPDDKYSCRYMQIFWQQLQTPLSQKGMAVFSVFYCISEICMKFTKFWKKRRVT